jgi:hypothetical protein
VPWAVVGFICNLVTGIFFVVSKLPGPSNYTENLSFRLKMLFVVLAAANLIIFQLSGRRIMQYNDTLLMFLGL